MRLRPATVLLLAAGVSCLRVDEDARAWRLQDSVRTLSVVIAEVDRIIANPNATAEHVAQATKVAASVKDNLDALEDGKLSKRTADTMNKAAIAELASFVKDIAAAGNPTDKMAVVSKMLDAKKAELAKSDAQAQILNLEMEKKQKQDQLEQVKDAKEMANLKHLVNEFHESVHPGNASNSSQHMRSIALTHSSNLSKSLPDVLQAVEERQFRVSAEITKNENDRVDAEEQSNAEIARATFQPGSTSDVAKRQTSLRFAKAEKIRKISEVRAQEQAELRDLMDAEKSIKSNDVAGLHQILGHIPNGAELLK